MSEFDGTPFVAGSITGLRSFRVDRLGRLSGVSYKHVWRPGVNRAKCGGRDRSQTIQLAIGGISYGPTYGFATGSGGAFTVIGETAPEEVKVKPRPVSLVKHRAGQLGCSCGYYAYFDDGSNPHHGSDCVRGVIEGFGTVTVGSRGFRAEKARLVALIDPKSRDGGLPLDGAARWFEQHDILAPLSFVFSVLGGVFGLVAMIMWATVSLWGLTMIPLWLGIVLLGYLSMRSIYVPDAPTPDSKFDLVRRNYPDIPVYRTVAAALAEHPLTPPPAPTPDDADFWTRDAS